MKIGILGAGSIGKTLVQRFSAAGHDVKIANSRGPETISADTLLSGGRAVTAQDALVDVDVVIVSIPFYRNPDVAPLLAGLPAGTVIIDTSNYYPARDSKIEAIEAGQVESLWASEQFGRPIIKAWNAILSQTLLEGAQERGAPGRIAIPIAGDDDAAKAVVAELVSDSGFDAVDAGQLADSWRFQPGTPAYCTDLTAQEVTLALPQAVKERAPENRDRIMQSIMDGKVPMRRIEMVANNRALSI
jgi:predicted dinucleotide-binding enzyme